MSKVKFLFAVSVLMVVLMAMLDISDAAGQIELQKSGKVICACETNNAYDADSGETTVKLPITIIPDDAHQGLLKGVLLHVMVNEKRFNYSSSMVKNASHLRTMENSVYLPNGIVMLIVSLDLSKAKWGDSEDSIPPPEIDLELEFTALTRETQLNSGIPMGLAGGTCIYAALLYGELGGSEATIQNCVGIERRN